MNELRDQLEHEMDRIAVGSADVAAARARLGARVVSARRARRQRGVVGCAIVAVMVVAGMVALSRGGDEAQRLDTISGSSITTTSAPSIGPGSTLAPDPDSTGPVSTTIFGDGPGAGTVVPATTRFGVAVSDGTHRIEVESVAVGATDGQTVNVVGTGFEGDDSTEVIIGFCANDRVVADSGYRGCDQSRPLRVSPGPDQSFAVPMRLFLEMYTSRGWEACGDECVLRVIWTTPGQVHGPMFLPVRFKPPAPGEDATGLHPTLTLIPLSGVDGFVVEGRDFQARSSESLGVCIGPPATEDSLRGCRFSGGWGFPATDDRGSFVVQVQRNDTIFDVCRASTNGCFLITTQGDGIPPSAEVELPSMR
jgi:hypothetical protein